MASDNSKVIKELLEIIKHKVGLIEGRQSTQSVQINLISDQQSVMNEKLDELKVDLKKLDKKADAILEFAEAVDETTEDNRKRLSRIERIPVIARALSK